MKKILVDTKTVLPLYTCGFVSGIGRSTYELLRALDRKESLPFEVILFSQSLKGVSPKRDFHFRNLHFYLPDRPVFRRVTNSLRMKSWFVRYDLLQMPNNLAQVPECPEKAVYTVHDLAVCRYPEMWPGTNLDRLLQILKERLGQCRAVVTCSRATKDDIVRFVGIDPGKIEVIPWGIDRRKFRPSAGTGYAERHNVRPSYFFCSSCNHPRKNLPVLLAAYGKYVGNGGKRQLVLLNPLPECLNDYTPLIAAGNIVVCRDIRDEDLVELYGNAHCTFLISAYEGFGFPILESLSCGTPVVSAGNSSLPEVGGEVVRYLDEVTADSVCEMMEKIDGCGKESLLDAAACRAHLDNFTWDICADRYTDFYKSLLDL